MSRLRDSQTNTSKSAVASSDTRVVSPNSTENDMSSDTPNWRNKLRNVVQHAQKTGPLAEEVARVRVEQRKMKLESTSHNLVENAVEDNSSFPDPEDFLSIESSCDLKPLSFGPASPELRVGSKKQLSNIITNARKVDQSRLASKVHSPRKKGALLDHNATVSDIIEPNEKISVEEANSRLISKLKSTIKHLTDHNKSLTYQKDTFELNWKKEMADHQSNINAKQKEVEERNLKLAVLEQHFCALNDPQKQEEIGSSLKDKDNEETNDEKRQNALPPSAVISSTNTVGQSNVSSSIIQLDKSHYAEMQNDLKKTKDGLANLEVKYAAEMKESTDIQMDLNNQVKDLNEALSNREDTISRLEKSLKGLREARFKKKAPNKEKSRKAAEPTVIKEVGSPSVTDNEDEDTTRSISKTDSLASVDIEQAIATAVESALEEREDSHRTSIQLLTNQMAIKDKIIKRLEAKCFSLVKSKTADPVPRTLMVRNVAATNEALNVTIQRLERLVEPLTLAKGNGVEPIMNKEDEFSSIRRVAAKVSLVQEELKLSMKLIEKQIENGIEKVRQAKSSDESVHSVEENNEDSKSLKDIILKVQDESMTDLRRTENAITKIVDGLKEQLQTIEFELESKQDTIEALEHACSEHIENCRGLQEKIEDLTSKLEREDTTDF